MNLKLTINNVEVSNSNLLDRVEFVADMGAEDFTVGKFIVPTAKIKLHNDVDIKIGDVVQIIIDNTTYGTYEPYDIKQQNLYREVTLYAMPYFALTKTYQPSTTNYTTRSLLLEMQTNIGFSVSYFADVQSVDMKNVQADTGINLLQAIAMLIGTNVIINSNGNVQFKKINRTSNGNSTIHKISQSQITSVTKSDATDYHITQITGKLNDSDEEPIVVGTSANAWNSLTLINPYLTTTICNNILGGLPTYTGFDLTIFNAPHIKPLDRVRFTYKDVEYTIPVMNLTISFSTGGLIATVQSSVSNSQAKSSNYKGTFTSKLEILKNVQTELNTKVEIVDGNVSSLISRTDVVEGEITTVKDQYSQINQTMDEINLRVENTEMDIVDVENDITSLSQRVSSAELKITEDAIVSTVTSSQVFKDSLATDGANYILNSQFELDLLHWEDESPYDSNTTVQTHSSSGGYFRDYPYFAYIERKNVTDNYVPRGIIQDFSVGSISSQTWTLSFWYYASGSNNTFDSGFKITLVGTSSDNISNHNNREVILDNANIQRNKWTKFTYTFEDLKSPHQIKFQVVQNGSIYFTKIKLEAGNIATDWKESTSDIKENYQVLETRVSQLEITSDGIDMTVSKLEENYLQDTRNLLLYSDLSILDDMSQVKKFDAHYWASAERGINSVGVLLGYSVQPYLPLPVVRNGMKVFKVQIDTNLGDTTRHGIINTQNNDLSLLEDGKTYTMSAYFMIESGTLSNIKAGLGLCSDTGMIVRDLEYYNIESLGKWYRFSRTFTYVTDKEYPHSTYAIPTFVIQNTDGNYTGYICAMALVEGEKCVTWNPAPQELEDEIDGIIGQVTTNTQSISQLQIDSDSINATVQKIETTTATSIDGINTELSTLTQKVDATMSAEDIQFLISSELTTKGTNKVTTETGFTFDKDGLTISKSDSEMSTLVDEDGMTIYKNNEIMLDVNNQGVDAQNIKVGTYLIVGNNSRFENYGQFRTGCFFIGQTTATTSEEE